MNGYVLFGLGAAVSWGSADFCAKKAADRFGFWPTVLAMNAVGALVLLGAAAAGQVRVPAGQMEPLIWLGVGNTLGSILFYFALEYGPLALVSPITAAYPVVSVFCAYLVSGERLQRSLAVAVAGVIGGTVLASLTRARPEAPAMPRRRWALSAAAMSAVVFGVVFFFLAAHAGQSGGAAPVLVFRTLGTLLLALPLLAGRKLPGGLFRSGWIWATGLLDSFAYLLYAIGGRHLPVSVDSALSGLFSIWTLVLALVFLRERLAPWQWAGVGFILAAIAVLAVH